MLSRRAGKKFMPKFELDSIAIIASEMSHLQNKYLVLGTSVDPNRECDFYVLQSILIDGTQTST